MLSAEPRAKAGSITEKEPLRLIPVGTTVRRRRVTAGSIQVPDALGVQFLQLSRGGCARGNNSPERPFTGAYEAGGANRGNFRPGRVAA